MANKRSHKRRSHSKSRTMRQRGGDLGQNPPSSWGWMLGTVGTGPEQVSNVNAQPTQSNDIVPLASQQNVGAPPQSGGKRRRHRSRSKRGGNLGALGAVLKQAVVPGTLVFLNQSAKRRRHRR